jgi:mRNA (guanine-N7-)-methyltransferase
MKNNGFDVVSCQFAIHYFMRTNVTFSNFLQNLNSVSKIGTFFIGTCLDALSVHTELSKSDAGELSGMNDDGVRVWNIKKSYDTYPTKDDPYGKEINVYVHSIGKEAAEYLVDYDILTDLLATIGFAPLQKKRYNSLRLTSASELFANVKTQTGRKDAMSPYESSYSYLHRWFIFEKISNTKIQKKKKTGGMSMETE